MFGSTEHKVLIRDNVTDEEEKEIMCSTVFFLFFFFNRNVLAY